MNRQEFYTNLSKYKQTNEQLQHYGIIGQKWGTRRWQNADGTFNEEGKIRYFGSKKAEEKLSDQKIGGLKDFTAKNFMIVNDNHVFKKIKKNPQYYNTGNLTDDEIMEAVRRVEKHPLDPNAPNYGVRLRKELYNTKLQKEKMENEYKVKNQNSKSDYERELNKILDKKGYVDADDIEYLNQFSTEKIGNNQKIGVGIIPAAITIATGVMDYNNTNELRYYYDKAMDESSYSYTPEERLSVLNNKKKIAKMENALNEGKIEKYQKILNKFKGEDKEIAEKFIKDINKKANDLSKVPEDTSKGIENTLQQNKLGSISKPKIKPQYLNDDGTLNDLGKSKAKSKSKTSQVASSVFKALRNLDIYSSIVDGPLIAAMMCSGFGVPMALAMGLGTTIASAGLAGVNNALYKKLEKRADAYYNMMK